MCERSWCIPHYIILWNTSSSHWLPDWVNQVSTCQCHYVINSSNSYFFLNYMKVHTLDFECGNSQWKQEATSALFCYKDENIKWENPCHTTQSLLFTKSYAVVFPVTLDWIQLAACKETNKDTNWKTRLKTELRTYKDKNSNTIREILRKSLFHYTIAHLHMDTTKLNILLNIGVYVCMLKAKSLRNVTLAVQLTYGSPWGFRPIICRAIRQLAKQIINTPYTHKYRHLKPKLASGQVIAR